MQPSLTNYQIKLLAALTMVIDHIGYLFFPDIYVFRLIGRFSFPLFAWLLVQGEAHTRNVRQYGIRLLVWGILSQPIYLLTFGGEWDLNILFTLLVGLICLRMARAYPHFQAIAWVSGAIVAELTRMDYGAYGIALIALLWKFKPHPLWWLAWLGLHLLMFVALSPDLGMFQLPAVFSPAILWAANHRPGAKARWFYLFYPFHLFVLFMATRLLGAG